MEYNRWGHEVLWVIRECISGDSTGKTSLSATQEDLAVLLKVVKGALDVPIVGESWRWTTSIRNAVETALPGAAHGLYISTILKPRNRFAIDRHAKKRTQKAGAGVRAIERSYEA